MFLVVSFRLLHNQIRISADTYFFYPGDLFRATYILFHCLQYCVCLLSLSLTWLGYLVLVCNRYHKVQLVYRDVYHDNTFWHVTSEDHTCKFGLPLIPLPSSMNVFLDGCSGSSGCPSPLPLPDDAVLLCGDSGAWSDNTEFGRPGHWLKWASLDCNQSWTVLAIGSELGGANEGIRRRGAWWVVDWRAGLLWWLAAENNLVENAGFG